MLNNGPVDSHIISLLQKGGVKQVVPFIEQLQPTHNIDAVHDEINRFLNPTLWLAFCSNKAIQTRLNESKLRDMYLTALLKAADPDAQPEWQAVLLRLAAFKDHFFANIQTPEERFHKAAEWEDVPTQCKVLAELPQADADSRIFKALLLSPHTALWHAFISNRMLTARLLRTQYAQLIETLQINVKGCHDEQSRKEWLIVLGIYALKLYPANYSEKICPDEDAADKTVRFGILLDYAITQIQTFGQVDSQDANIETVRWLLFALKLAENPPTLALWQEYSLFQQTLPFKWSILSPAFAMQFLKAFPNFFTPLLKHIYNVKAEYGQNKYHLKYRELVTLVRLLQAHPQLGVIIKADAQCCELLGVAPVLVPIPASIPAQSSSSSAMLTDDDNEVFGLAPIIEIIDDTMESEATMPRTEQDIFDTKDDDSLESVEFKESDPLLPQAKTQKSEGFWQRLFTPCFKSCLNRSPKNPTPAHSDDQRGCLYYMDAIVRFGQARRP
ncbi:MAG: hypothetical protein AB7I18_07720 [Candidatus Berkiella sp.]